MKNAVRGGQNGNKAGKKEPKENKAGKDAGEKRRSNADRKGQSLEAELIAEPMTAETAEDQPAKKRHRGGRKRRGASGEKLPQQPAQAAQPRKAETSRAERSDRSPRNGNGRGERSAQAGARPSDNRFGNSRGGRGRNREERRNGKEVDYHRVYVTGLNSVVWPDPPGYHERKERDEATKAAASKPSASRRPRPHRKTEGGTANSK